MTTNSMQKALTEEAVVSILGQYPTPTVANAIEMVGVRDVTEGYADSRLRCLFVEMPPMVGFAVTATVDSTTSAKPDPTRGALLEMFKLVEDSKKPAVLVLQEVGQNPVAGCHAGEIVARIARRLGCVGIVSDAGVRDITEVKELGLQYFSMGHVASHGSFRVVRVGQPVQVANMEVETGQLLHGDLNGLLTVPKDLDAHHLLEMISRVEDRERRLFGMIESEEFSMATLKEHYGTYR